MVHAIRMPKPGQMTEECTVVAWHKKRGRPGPPKGDILFEIETDKSAMEVEAFDDGVLLQDRGRGGRDRPGQHDLRLRRRAGRGDPGRAGPDRAVAAPPAARPTPAPPPAAAPAAPPPPPPPRRRRPRRLPRGDRRAARLRDQPAREPARRRGGLDPRAIAGTGPDGRIVERDVRAAMAAPATAAAAGGRAAAAARRGAPAVRSPPWTARRRRAR